jgi:hypothetical protein
MRALTFFSYLFVRVFLWPLSVVPLALRSRKQRRLADGLDAMLLASVEPGETWNFTFSAPRFPRGGVAPAALTVDLAAVEAARATRFESISAFAPSTEDMHLELRMRDGRRLSFYERADGSLYGPRSLPAVVAELEGHGTRIAKHHDIVRFVPGFLDPFIGMIWIVILLGLVGLLK